MPREIQPTEAGPARGITVGPGRLNTPVESRSAPRRGHSFLMVAGALVLFAACTEYGVLEVHSSTDTWISLAAGKQISDEWAAGRGVPTHDTFSYTAHGQPWYNQNWLAHYLTFWLYDRIGPDAVIWGTWLTNLATFALAGLACWFRSGSVVGSLVAGALVAFGSRDFVSARPATLGFFCLAMLWMLLCALEGQGERRRWWPIVLLVPLLVFFGMVHGSFVFAYALLGLYVAHAAVMKVFAPRWAVASWSQLIGVCAAVIAAILLTLLGPLGIGNFIHPEKIASSNVFRTVQEWIPPYMFSRPGMPSIYPPSERFWILLAASVFGVALAAQFTLMGRKAPVNDAEPRRHWSFFDVAVAALGLGMSLFARRFIPMFYIFAAPGVVLVYQAALPRLGESLRSKIRVGFTCALWAGAALIGLTASALGYQQLYADRAAHPDLNLFERVTRFDREPNLGVQYLVKNAVAMNLLVEWGQAGTVMLKAPLVKVYMDGRAQQVYDEKLYIKYVNLLILDKTKPEILRQLLNESPRTDGVLIRLPSDFYTGNLWRFLERDPEWALVFVTDHDSGLFVRRNSEPMRALLARLAAGEEWRPDTPDSIVARGRMRTMLQPPDLEHALQDWETAVERDAAQGLRVYAWIAVAYRDTGRLQEAEPYFRGQLQQLASRKGLTEKQQSDLRTLLEAVLRTIRTGAGWPATRPNEP